MRAIMVLALREWRGAFLSPLAWTLLAVLFGLNAFMFNAALGQYVAQQMQFQMYGANQDLPLTDWVVAPVLGNSAVILLLLVPLVSMRLIADEKRRETWPALASSPLTAMQIVWGKYIGLLLFLLAAVLLLAIPPLTLYPFGSPDTGQMITGLAGLFLLSASFGAVGLATSSATDNPIVAAISSFGILLLLWIISWMGETSGSALDQTLAYLSMMSHYEKFLHGVVNSEDLIYFLILTAFGLLFTRQRLLHERIHG
ncbi:MAG: ABC transporter permease subunit [Magnetococcales bacterium]|nr:ABC transporter permease subunit [Magnetococcales bacterium]